MSELLRTNDPILISWLRSILGGIGIEIVVFDEYASYLQGSSYAIPLRVMVSNEDLFMARSTFEKAVTELNYNVGAYEFPG